MATYGKGTYTVSGKDITPSWYIVDAEDVVLGRLASQVASVLKGKHRPDYSPHLDLGDRVIVINAAKMRLTGKKLEQKTYFRHSGYPSGSKFTSLARLMEENPEKVVEYAVQGMLPKGKLGRALLRKLRVYAGPENPHVAQNPEPLLVV